MKKVQLVFTDEQWEVIEDLKGIFGEKDAEIVRNVVLSWLSEKSLISERVKKQKGGEG